MDMFDGMELMIVVGYMIFFRDMLIYTMDALWNNILAGSPLIATDALFADPIIVFCIASIVLVQLTLFNIMWMKAFWG